jgi:hypothetical protein
MPASKRVAKHEKVGKAALAPTENRKKSSNKGKREERAAKKQVPTNPLIGLAKVAVAAWVAMGVSFMTWNHGNGTLLPDWAEDALNPGTITMNLMEAGDGENTPVQGDEVSIDYTATVTATGKTFDTTQGRGPMTFEVGEEPPKALIGLDLGVQNMTLGETAELQVSSAFAFGSRSVGEGENVVPPRSDITFVVTLVAINDLHMPEPEEEEESYEDNWDDLGDDEQEAASLLGWGEDTWGYHTELTQVPFADLTEDQQEAADVLGYDETSWDDPEEFMEEGDEDDGEDEEGGE